jgi:hypothetical protein
MKFSLEQFLQHFFFGKKTIKISFHEFCLFFIPLVPKEGKKEALRGQKQKQL